MSESIPAPTPPPEIPAADAPKNPEITIDQFLAVDLRLGVVVHAEAHPDAERLLVLKVDIGEPEPRQVVAGIRADWTPEAITGRSIIIAANLKPAKLRGLWSHGMILAVRGSERVIPLTVDGPVAPGTRVT
ncbi:MAG TPA: methionine--tRNA ligase subunit beta [Planctomycetota bacterium]|jgi:methionyl-tRNA synthetase|nr:methionine--tRNA ligase subunit beta [Planctomycetota bacterium]